MQQRRKIRYLIAFVLLTAGILVLLLCNIGIGTVKIPLTEILTTGRTKEGMNARILWEIRFPRTLAAGILGGALALAGYLLQTFFHNPIAGPFCTGNFFRGEDGSGTGDGIFAGEYDPGQLRTVDPGGIFRSYVVHGIRAPHGEEGR